MDQPLDLSQRDEGARRSEYSMDVEEPICSYQNCSCPLKHIMTLESPKRRDTSFGNTRYPPQTSFGRHQDQTDFDEGQSKRSLTSEYSGSSLYHPKKRKIEMYKQQTMARSSSDNSLNSLDETSSTHTQLKQYREYSPNGDVTYHDNESKDDTFYKPRHSPSLMRHHNDDACTDQMSQDTPSSADYSIRTLSGSNVQRAPKKRHASRHISLDSNGSGSQAMGHNYPQMLNMPSQYPSEHRQAQSSASRAKSHTASATVTYSEAQEYKENQLKEQKFDLKSIKADMIREIDEFPDTDDIPTFRKKLFESIMESAKSSKNAICAPGGKSSALDYLISKKLLHGEDKPFVAKNNHLNQIIRGEKTGKLCLMDIVELQVEIGLA